MSAYINTIATIIYAEAIVSAINKNTTCDDPNLQKILQTITDTCEHAYTCWKQATDKDSAKLLKLFVKMQQSMIENENTPETYTNFVIGQLDDLIGYIKDPYRRAALLGIYDAVFALHMYFDKNLDQSHAIDNAVDAMKQWQECISM